MQPAVQTAAQAAAQPAAQLPGLRCEALHRGAHVAVARRGDAGRKSGHLILRLQGLLLHGRGARYL